MWDLTIHPLGGLASSLTHRSVTGSDTICNSPSPPLANIVLFGLSLLGFKSCLRRRGFHTENSSFSSSTDVGSHINPLRFHSHILTSMFHLCNTISGTIDMDLINTGVSASERMRRESLLSATRNIIMEKMQLGGPSIRLSEVCC